MGRSIWVRSWPKSVQIRPSGPKPLQVPFKNAETLDVLERLRPHSIRLLSFAQFLLPAIAVLSDHDLMRSIEIFSLMPLAGLAIYLARNWSYPIFLSCVAWNIHRYISVWKTEPDLIFSPWIWVLVQTINVLCVTYFILPWVRRNYLTPDQDRWWETRSRYPVRLKATLVVNQRKFKASLHNLSLGGALIQTSEDLQQDEQVELRFSVLTKDYLLKGVVAYCVKGSLQGYGIQFQHDEATEEDLFRLCHCLEILRVQPERYDRGPERISRAVHWLKGLKPASKKPARRPPAPPVDSDTSEADAA